MDQGAQTSHQISGTIFGLRLFGVPVRFHFTFVLLVVALGAVGIQGPSGAEAAIYILALFASVLVHELGHALVSKRYGIKTIEIVMFPIGGVARLERNPKPREELWIALAGPAVNIVIAALLIVAAASLNRTFDWEKAFSRGGGDMLSQVAIGNIILGVFNLLPAFPMDGGRVLRAMLAMKRGEAEATAIAARAGRFLAILMGLYGLVAGNFVLLFVAFFVYLGAVQETAAVMGRALTQGVPVSEAMITEFRTLSHGQTIRDAANLLLATTQQDFPVVLGDQVLGLLGRSGLLRAMAQDGPEAYISGAMQREFLSVSPLMDLSEALPLLTQAGNVALVMDEDKLVGMLTGENLMEFLMLRRLGMGHRG
ncbi:MAG: M50 family metallopeptidase [Bryobacterales bacterium]|nr:M50 family metallopeptidase [Bryobacterales bacterium]